MCPLTRFAAALLLLAACTGAAAAYGASQRAGIQAAAADVTDPKIQVIVEDDGSTKEQLAVILSLPSGLASLPGRFRRWRAA